MNGFHIKTAIFFLVTLHILTFYACSEVVKTGDAPTDRFLPDSIDGLDVIIDGMDVPVDGECGEGETLCGNTCVNLGSDVNHCGSCENACAEGEVCSNGSCTTECAPGLTNCGGSCVDTSEDVSNCGICDNECPTPPNARPVCIGGECSFECLSGWSDITDDPGCETECTFVSPDEICNGIDDNCNGSVDEGFDCPMGRETACTTTCGSIGTGVCGVDCTYPSPESCNPPEETCNGVDDDCDGAVDNGFPCPRGVEVDCITDCGTGGRGICSSTCEIPTGSACASGPEICNGIDDNCNGAADETFDCVMGASVNCTTACGSAGTGVCGDDCTMPSPADCTPPAETCNGIDDDCDGACDNGFACCRGSMGSCPTTCGSTGTRTCSATCIWGACNPPAETCNGMDDDCDGACDNGFACCAGTSRGCSVGLCSGTETCSSSCTWGSCDLGSPPGNDACGGAIDVGSGGSFSGTTCGANSDLTSSCGGSGPDVVYRMTLSSRSDVVVETCGGASFDTVLHIRSGCPGSEVACNDDNCGLQSRIDTTLDGGTYYIIVDGLGSAAGPFTLNVSITAAGLPNDDCTSPAPITIGNEVTVGTNVGGIHDYTGSCGGSGPDVVYSFTLSSTSDLFIGVHTTDMDPVIYLSTTCGGSTYCNDDAYPGVLSSVLVLNALSSGTYYLVVDGLGGSTGNFTIETYRHGDWIDGDGCGNPHRLYNGVGGNTWPMWDDYTPSCRSLDSKDEVFYFILESTSTVTVDTCAESWDTVLFMRDDCDSSTDVACNDDGCGLGQSWIGPTLAPGIYFLFGDGYNGASGSYHLNVSGL